MIATMRQARLAAWSSFEFAGSFSNAWVSTLTSWKPSKACTPGNTTRASVSIWVMRCSSDVSCCILSSRAVAARFLVTCLTAATQVWQRVPAAQPKTEKEAASSCPDQRAADCFPDDEKGNAETERERQQ